MIQNVAFLKRNRRVTGEFVICFLLLLFVVDFDLCFGGSIQVVLEKDKLDYSFICSCSLLFLGLCIST